MESTVSIKARLTRTKQLPSHTGQGFRECSWEGREDKSIPEASMSSALCPVPVPAHRVPDPVPCLVVLQAANAPLPPALPPRPHHSLSEALHLSWGWEEGM